MSQSFEQAYATLNKDQKLAVDTIDGPVLVIAGPGTGKTQLLTLRVASILQKTDTLPENILCLTFTEAAVATMRERLANIIGKASYDVTVTTYHAFGSELLKRYPEYFNSSIDAQPADDLTIDTIYREIMKELSYDNPLRHDAFLGDVRQLISDAKRALLSPADIRTITKDNQSFIQQISRLVGSSLDQLVRVDKRSVGLFSKLSSRTQKMALKTSPLNRMSLGAMWHQELNEALSFYEETAKTTLLTKWKNNWLAKDTAGKWVAAGHEQNNRIAAIVPIYEQYLQKLEARNLYDYDDMILRAIQGLEAHPDLRYTLQERYLYVLLDEFQDTNEAQARLVELLNDSPVNEGRPNVLAVGDDDQAIYAFQGANYSHMLHFYERYRDVLVVALTQNYRSSPAIIHLAGGVVGQISERLPDHFPAMTKTITPAGTKARPGSTVERHEFKTMLSQNTWVARSAAALIENGTTASEIAILAPKHEHLENIVPFLRHAGVAIQYEKRDNVLDDGAIEELVIMAQLAIALSEQDHVRANALWPQVLSFSFWNVPTSIVWQLSWRAHDQGEQWTEILLESEETRPIALFFIAVGNSARTTPLEMMLDTLIGITPLNVNEKNMPAYQSPFYEGHFSLLTGNEGDTRSFWQLLSNLTILRERLREYRASELVPLSLVDFINFVKANREAGLKILNTNPYQEADQAVELMTAYKSKGREFSVVFVLAASDEVWGSKARTRGSRISLPANLQFIRYPGSSEDERLRLLYVALSRAKSQLYITNYMTTYTNKTMTRLKYFDEHENDQGELISPLFPVGQQVIHSGDVSPPELSQLAVNWQEKHYQALVQPPLKNLLQPRLDSYQLSPTQCNTFLDVRQGGPSAFFMQCLLHFPVAATVSMEYGKAIHETLEWIDIYNKQHTGVPSLQQAKQQFKKNIQHKRLETNELSLLIERATVSLKAYLQQRASTIDANNYAEYNFRDEGVFIGDAHLSGKIDKLIVNRTNKTITIVDYKTGKSHARWERDARLHFYRYQLYFYKLLVERSHTFHGYSVNDAYLEFIDPDSEGHIQELHILFDAEELAKLESLIERVWHHVLALDFPNTNDYTADLSGIEDFENDLLEHHL